MKKIRELLSKPWAAYTFAACSAVILYLLLSHVSEPVAEWFQSVGKMFSPIVLGVAMAYLLNPLVNFFENKVFRKIRQVRIKHMLSVILAIVSSLLVLALLLVLLVPALIDSVTTIVNNADHYVESAQKMIARVSERFGDNADLNSWIENLDEWVSKLLTMITDNMGTILSKITNIGSSIVNIGLGAVLAIYFLVDKENILKGINKLRKVCMTTKAYENQTVFLERCHSVFLQYILYSLLDGLIVGVSNAIFMTCMRMPYVPLVSVVVGVTNLLPTFGPIIGVVVGTVVLIFDKPILAVWFWIFCAVIQTLDANVIKPKLFHDSLGLPAVMTLISIIIGGKLFGVIGIFLAIPVTVVLRFLYNENFLPWMERNKKKREALLAEIEYEKQQEETSGPLDVSESSSSGGTDRDGKEQTDIGMQEEQEINEQDPGETDQGEEDQRNQGKLQKRKRKKR